MTLSSNPSQTPRDLVNDRLPALPLEAHTRDGQLIHPGDDVWTFRKRRGAGGVLTLDWGTLRGLSEAMIHLSKVILTARAANYASYSTRNDFEMLRRLGAWYDDFGSSSQSKLDWSHVDRSLGERWLAYGMTGAHQGNEFARLRDLYRFGVVALRHAEFSPATLLALETVRAPGNLKGNAVRDGDPEKGYFAAPEVDLIVDAIGAGKGSAEQRAVIWLSLETGRNALQYTLLTNADLTRVELADDAGQRYIYQVHTRRIKKRTVEDEKVGWPISVALGDLLWSLRKGSDESPLLHWLNPTQPELALTQCMQAWATTAELVSPRTGRRLRLNARRFRVTMLTNAADEGMSAEHLAILADHTDLQNIQVYIDRSPFFLQRIQEKVDAIYDPIVRRFKGTFTTTEVAAREGAAVIPGTAVHLPVLDVGGVGVCGKQGLCKLAPPLTCYPCPHFVAFRDGPHARVVEALEQFMRGMDERIGLQLAAVLAAAREVVAQIAAERLIEGAS